MACGQTDIQTGILATTKKETQFYKRIKTESTKVCIMRDRVVQRMDRGNKSGIT